MSDWSKLLTRDRLRPPSGPPSPGDEGNEFLSDYYRVVFASSFRRLQDKTQVSPLAETDYVRRRLTHSVEVAAIGERMGRVVAPKLQGRLAADNVRDDLGKIVATACLLHDIGNPPFGHEGELAIRQWADRRATGAYDLRAFDGNAQGFRIAVRLQHLGEPFGLNLTAATLATMLKYPVTPAADNVEGRSVEERGKWSVMGSERAHYERVADLVGLPHGQRHPLSYLVEAADDIVNRLVDIEDAMKLKLIAYQEVCDTLTDLPSSSIARNLLDTMEKRRKTIASEFKSERELWAYQYFRVRATTELSKACERLFAERLEEVESGEFHGELAKKCEHSDLYLALRGLEYDRIFADPSIVRVEAGGKRAIDGLLDIFADAVESDTKLARILPLPLEVDGQDRDLFVPLQRVVDYVSGMTDRYAVGLFQELTGTSL